MMPKMPGSSVVGEDRISSCVEIPTVRSRSRKVSTSVPSHNGVDSRIAAEIRRQRTHQIAMTAINPASQVRTRAAGNGELAAAAWIGDGDDPIAAVVIESRLNGCAICSMVKYAPAGAALVARNQDSFLPIAMRGANGIRNFAEAASQIQ